MSVIDALGGVEGLHSSANEGSWARAIQRHAYLSSIHRTPKALAERVTKLTGERVDSMLGDDRQRADGFDANAGYALALDLTHMHAEVLTEPRPIRSALEIFNRDTSVPFGARQVRVVRQYGSGRAQLHRGGQNIPRVGISRKEEFYPIVYPVAGYVLDVFEQASNRFMGGNLPSDKASECVDAIEELINHLAWNGDDAFNVQGVLNYKWLARRTITQGFSAATVAANPQATLAALTDLVRWPQANSKGAMRPDSVCWSERIDAALAQIPSSSYGNATIRELFLKANPHIVNVFVVPELEDAGGAGIDGIFAFLKEGRRGVRLVLPQGVTFLPMQTIGLDMLVPSFAATGGIRMEDIGNQILGLADTSA